MTDSPTLRTRQRAADLLAAAARHPHINAGAVLECLLAENALGVPGRPIGTEVIYSAAWDELVTAAMRALANLPASDFDDPAVLTATRHAQRAMWRR